MDNDFYELGKAEAYDTLASWQELGWPSLEECRQHLEALMSTELAQAQEQVQATDGAALEVWQRDIEYFKGHLAALR